MVGATSRPRKPFQTLAGTAHLLVLRARPSSAVTARIHSRARLSSFSRSSGVSACSANLRQSWANSFFADTDDARHLVVLDLLGRSDQREVGRRFILLLPFGHDLLTLLDDSHHALASLRPRLDVEQVEALFEPLDLGFGFLQMRLEQLLQLRNRTNSWALILGMIGLGEQS